MEENKSILQQFDKPYPDMDLTGIENAKLLGKIGFYSSQISGLEVNPEHSWNDFKGRYMDKKVPVISLNRRMVIQFAAVLVLGVFLSWFFLLNREVISTQIAENKTVILPDNSEVVLNSESRISYKERTWMSDRSLKLDGEAFFKVEKGQTFRVKTSHGMVQVLGTQFNVNSRNGFFEVVCFEGRVLVKSEQESRELTAGKGFRILDDKIVKLPDFTNASPDWLARESSFVAVPLIRVFEELQRQYDVKVILSESIDENKLFSGTITHSDLEKALQSICLPLKLNYQVNDKTISISQ